MATVNGHSNEAQEWTSRPRHKTKAIDIIIEDPFILKLSRRVIATWPPYVTFYSTKSCLISRAISNSFVAILSNIPLKIEANWVASCYLKGYWHLFKKPFYIDVTCTAHISTNASLILGGIWISLSKMFLGLVVSFYMCLNDIFPILSYTNLHVALRLLTLAIFDSLGKRSKSLTMWKMDFLLGNHIFFLDYNNKDINVVDCRWCLIWYCFIISNWMQHKIYLFL